MAGWPLPLFQMAMAMATFEPMAMAMAVQVPDLAGIAMK
jgi:hypothetical protein